LEDVASSCSSKALYVSGSPGTGKTALLQNILGRLESRLDASTSLAFSNCTTIQRSDDIWERLAEELGFSAVGKGKKRWDQNAFESALQASKKRL
jgi:cell division control protein 6